MRSEILRLECQRCRHHAFAVWRRMCCTSSATHSRLGRHAYLPFKPLRPLAEGTHVITENDSVRCVWEVIRSRKDGEVPFGAEGHCVETSRDREDLVKVLFEDLPQQQCVWVPRKSVVRISDTDGAVFALQLDIEQGKMAVGLVHQQQQPPLEGKEDRDHSLVAECVPPRDAECKRALAEAVVAYIADDGHRSEIGVEWLRIKDGRRRSRESVQELMPMLINPGADGLDDMVMLWQDHYEELTDTAQELRHGWHGRMCGIEDEKAADMCDLEHAMFVLADYEKSCAQLRDGFDRDYLSLRKFERHIVQPAIERKRERRGFGAAWQQFLFAVTRLQAATGQQRSGDAVAQEKRAWEVMSLAAKAEAMATPVCADAIETKSVQRPCLLSATTRC